MNKIIKLIFVVIFGLVTNSSHAITDPPFINIIVNKQPINYDDITFEDYEGNFINLNNENSEIFMLNFWATWCLPCKEEMPYLDKLQNTNGIKVFPINVGRENKQKTQIFFKNLEIKNLSIYFDAENNLVNLLKLRGLPTTVILNKEKKEIARIIGVVNFSDEKFIEWINDYRK